MINLIRLYRDPVVVDPAAAPAADPSKAAPAADPSKAPDFKPGSAGASVDINAAAAPSPETLHDAAIKAVEAWQANPTPELKTKAQAAVDAAKGALTAPRPFVIPDAYKDKAYLKGVDSQEKLFTMLDGAQAMIGKDKLVVPAADAPQAEKDAFYERLGRPKTAVEYKLPGVEKADPAFTPIVQAAMHKHGLSQEQAAGIYEDINAGLQKWMTDKGLVEAQQDVDFEKLATDSFGVERDKVLARGKELLGANISPAMRPAVDKLDNNALIVLADVLRNIDKKYIKSETPVNINPTLNGMTPAQLQAKGRELMAQQSKFDAFSPEFQSLQKQIDEIYNTMRQGVK